MSVRPTINVPSFRVPFASLALRKPQASDRRRKRSVSLRCLWARWQETLQDASRKCLDWVPHDPTNRPVQSIYALGELLLSHLHISMAPLSLVTGVEGALTTCFRRSTFATARICHPSASRVCHGLQALAGKQDHVKCSETLQNP